MQKLVSARVLTTLGSGVSLMALAYSHPVLAQQSAQADQPSASSSGGLEEIVVTARRKEEKAQSVPIALTSVTAASIENQQIKQAADFLKDTTSLTYAGSRSTAGLSSGGSFGGNYVWIRGVPGVVTYWADAPTPLTSALFFDLSSVQVLKGPQGTLFGQATDGGAAVFQPKMPTNGFEGFVQAEVGDYGHTEMQGVVNIPIIDDKLLLRIGGEKNMTDGYVYDIAHKGWLGSENFQLGRAIITYRPTDNLQNDLIGNYFSYNDSSGYNAASQLYRVNIAALQGTHPGQCLTCYITYGGPLGWYAVPGNPAYPGLTRESASQLNAIDTLRYDITDSLTVKNILSYVEAQQGYTQINQTYPMDPFPALGIHPQGPAELASEELQFLGKVLDDKLSYTFGTNYIWNQGSVSPHVPTYSCSFGGCSGSISYAVQRTNAVYGQGTYDLGDYVEGLSFTGGYRYTWDRLYNYTGSYFGTGPLAGQLVNTGPGGIGSLSHVAQFHAGSYTMSVDYQIDSKTMVYITDSKGYSKGGFNTGLTIPTAQQVFAPESLDNVEIGIKADWDLPYDMKARTNLSFFYGFYTNVQEPTKNNIIGPTGSLITVVVTQNAAEGHIQGFDYEVTLLPTDYLELSSAGTFVQTKYDNYKDPGTGLNWNNNVYPFAPKWTWNAKATYHLPIDESLGKLSLSAVYNYIGAYYGTVSPTPGAPPPPGNLDPASSNLDLNLSWNEFLGRSGLDARVYVTNLLNNHFAQGSASSYSVSSFPMPVAPPRMWGIAMKYAFGPADSSESSSAAAYTAPVVQAPAPRPPAAPRSYLVFFDFDKSDLTSEARQIVDTAARNATGVTRIEVTGHTDTVGSDEYNMRLSHRRAMAVSAEMQARGIPESEIAIFAKGKRALLVPTGDGVREPQNRRVEIVYSGGPGA